MDRYHLGVLIFQRHGGMKGPVNPNPISPASTRSHLIGVLLFGVMILPGCSILPKKAAPSETKHDPPQTSQQVAKPGSVQGKGFFHQLHGLLVSIHPFRHKPVPPKALGLRRIGTVRTLSNDGSYVIVELEPGTLVAPDSKLVITATGAAPATLRVSEIRPPYFVADVESGHPEPGDRVQQ